MMSNFIKTTESPSQYQALENQSVAELLTNMNQEDMAVPLAVTPIIPKIATFIEALVPRFEAGGRLFYIGAGTSGRLGVLDASEIPPTFGIPHERVVGLIAGGDQAIRKAVEFAEDSKEVAQKDLEAFQLTKNDVLVGIAASGTTPYVIGGVNYAKNCGVLTACITNNAGSPLAASVEHPLEIVVGPEFVTGSTRMKSGTAQKLVLNMISTALMIRVGRVKGNKMVNIQLNNNKLVDRGIRFIVEETGATEAVAAELLQKHGSVKLAIEAFKS